MTTDIIDQAVEAAVKGTEVVLRDAETFAITTNDDYQQAAVILREIKTRAKDIEEERKRIVDPIRAGIQRINDLFRPAQDNLAQAEGLIKRGIGVWNAEQDRVRREAEAAAAEIARKEAEKLQKRADKALEAGHIERAAALEGAADNVTAAPVAPPPKAFGVSRRTVWKAEVVDKDALIKAVAVGDVEAEALEVNTVYLNRAVQLRKDNLNWPGVNVVKEEVVVAQTGIRDQRGMPGR